MLSDPQIWPLDSPLTLPRTGVGPTSSTYTYADGGAISGKLTVSHNRAKRLRTSVRFDSSIVVADLLDPSLNVPRSFSTYMVIDRPTVGVDAGIVLPHVLALCQYLSDNDGALAQRILLGES